VTSQHQHDHTTRTKYTGTLNALLDAQRVQSDLLAAISDGDALFLDAANLAFLARRAHKLISACVDLERGRP
jgi:hypothetical protein